MRWKFGRHSCIIFEALNIQKLKFLNPLGAVFTRPLDGAFSLQK